MTYKQEQTAHRQTDKQMHTSTFSTVHFFQTLQFSPPPLYPLFLVIALFLSFPPSLLLCSLYLSSSLFPSSVPLLFINLNLSVCAPWSKMSTQSKHALAHRAMCHIISPTRSQRHRQAYKENQITFICPFSSESLCAYVCTRLCI